MNRYSVKGIGLDYDGGDPVPRIGKFTLVFGFLHDMYPRIMFYAAPLNIVMMVAITYKTVISTNPDLAWVTLPLFLIVVGVGLVVGALFVWFVTIPQNYYYSNWLSLRNGNVTTKMILDRFDKIDEKLEELKKRL